ncbi:MAG: aldo/keto reductase [Clostridiaceae bacterium]|nr:aldo/keto reductase [Clostridiaceae bacterium]
MGLGGGWNKNPIEKKDIIEAQEAIEAALEIGINFFDHANIYQFNKSEEVFGEYLKSNKSIRDKIYIQSKVGIILGTEERKGQFDFSYDHIIKEVTGSLERLKTDYLDCLLLHRPDPLMEVKELKATIDYLFKNGMIKNIGVSNMSQHQIKHIAHYIERPIVANQLEMSLYKLDFVNGGVLFNQPGYNSIDFPIGTLEYCNRKGISIQAWSPLARGIYTGKELDKDVPLRVLKTKEMVNRMAEEKGVTGEVIVLAWLMRHPASISPVIGTKNPDRIRATKGASQLVLTRNEWYDLFITSRGEDMP